MATSFDTDFPLLLIRELIRTRPQYLMRYICQPAFVWDATLQPGKQAQMDRYGYLGDDGSLTLDARRRMPDELIGTHNSRDLNKEKVLITIDEYTGPSKGDPNNPNSPGNLRLSYEKIKLAQRFLYDSQQFDNPALVHQFHQSIGSLTLFDDYSRWMDRVYANTLLQSTYTYNPLDVPDGGTYTNGPPKFDVKNDLNTLMERMRTRNVPTFDDGYYYLAASPRFMKHLRQDDDFRKAALSVSFVPAAYIQDPRMFGPGIVPSQPIDYFAQPNQLIFQGQGFNQARFGLDMMPTGIIFEGFRIFEVNNLPNQIVNLTYTNSSNTTLHPTGAANRIAYLGIAFGKEAIGEAMGTDMPVRVKRNENSDFGRFLILIWQVFFGISLLNPSFVQVCRTYGD